MELSDISNQTREPLKGGRLYMAICRTEVCSWFETGRMIQTTGDGNVYERPSGPRGQDKDFPKMSQDKLAVGRRVIEDVKQQDERNG